MREILESTPEKFRVLFQVLALTGARTGEVLGLQWKHVDLDKGQLRIEQSFWRGLLVAPKTRDSVRTIISRALTAATDIFVLFHCSEPRDLAAIADHCGRRIAERVATLSLHDCVIFDVVERKEIAFEDLFSQMEALSKVVPVHTQI